MEEEQKKENKLLWADIGPDKPNHDLILWIKIIGLGIFLFASGIIITNQFGWLDSISATEDSAEESASVASCNVQGTILRGDVVTYISPSDYNDNGDVIVDQGSSEFVVKDIEDAEKDDSIKAIIVEIDSYGGSGVAGEEIANALKSAKKPTVALIRGAGDSAAYWAAIGASRIFASKNSDVGSIGVTMSYLDAVEQNKKDGYTYNSLSVGTQISH